MYLVNKHYLNGIGISLIEVKQKNIRVTFMDYGATIMSIFVPDSSGNMETVVMAYKSLESYLNNDMYLNAIIGPTSGRIQDAKFSINNESYSLDKNFLGTENLHGGKECFAFRVFKSEVIDEPTKTKVIFTLTKEETGSSYPGKQNIKIIYTIKEGALLIEFIGDTNKDTLMNLTNHAYFNLSGNMKEDILEHELYINSKEHLELNAKLVPIKRETSIGTRFDFTAQKKIKENFFKGIYDLPTKGIDEPFLLGRKLFDHYQVKYVDNISKRVLKVYTTYPCIVIYTHNYPNSLDLLYGVSNRRHLGICFETQLEPNGINIDNENNGVLRKDQKYYYKTLYEFSIEK